MREWRRKAATELVRWPGLVAVLSTLPSFVCLGMLLNLQSEQPLTFDFSWGDFKIDGGEVNQREHAILVAMKDSLMEKPELHSKTIPLSRKFHPLELNESSFLSNQRQYSGEDLTIFYLARKEGDNLIRGDVIQKIRDIEYKITKQPGYELHCQTTTHGNKCAVANSIINFMFPSQKGNEYIYDGRGDKMRDPKQTLMQLLAADRSGFTSRDTSPTKLGSPIIVSQFRFGVPLLGFKDRKDRIELQKQMLSSYIDELGFFLSRFDKDESLPFRVLRRGIDAHQA